jgi:transposase-like protein
VTSGWLAPVYDLLAGWIRWCRIGSTRLRALIRSVVRALVRPVSRFFPRAERRRRWTAEQKLAIVGESLGPGLTPTEVARKHGISTGQIYTWRQQFLSYESSRVSRTTPRFTAVELASACTPAYPAPPELPPFPSPEKSPRLEGLIEVVLPSRFHSPGRSACRSPVTISQPEAVGS